MSDVLATLSDERVSLFTSFKSRAVNLRAGRHAFSGFLWRDGLVVTADEALPHGKEVHAVLDGQDPVTAEIAGRDATTDIALLRVLTTEAATQTNWTTDTPVGTSAFVVGADQSGVIAAAGIVSRTGSAWRSMRGGQIDARVELDAFMPAMAEGGLVVTADNAALGMAVFGPNQRVLVIPGSTIDRIAARLETDGRIPKGYVGMGLRPIKLDDGGKALLVANVDTDGPGAKAGLHQGDIVTTFDGVPVRSAR